MDSMREVSVLFWDLDDTLIATNHLYVETRDAFFSFVSARLDVSEASVKTYFVDLDAGKVRSTGHIKDRFAESMVFTFDVFAARVEYKPSAREYGFLRRLGGSVFERRGDNLPDAMWALETFRREGYRQVLYSAGDREVQNLRLDWSGLRSCFDDVEIVGHKTPAMIEATFATLGVKARNVCVIGNSLAQDVTPALAVGASAIHLDGAGWEADRATPDAEKFLVAKDLREVADKVLRHCAYGFASALV